MIVEIKQSEEKARICRDVLEALPDWFGIPESINEYVEQSKRLPLWADITDDKILGFIVLKETSPYTAELCVMGVKKQYHRTGIGRKLFQNLLQYAKEHGYEFLQVKTVQEGRYADYDMTNAFYQSLGFKEFECFPTLWDEVNPCQVYVMSIK